MDNWYSSLVMAQERQADILREVEQLRRNSAWRTGANRPFGAKTVERIIGVIGLLRDQSRSTRPSRGKGWTELACCSGHRW